jgi:hypothetical protein
MKQVRTSNQSFWEIVELVHPAAIIYPINATHIGYAYGNYYLKDSSGISLQLEEKCKDLRTLVADHLFCKGNIPALFKGASFDIIAFPIKDAFFYMSISQRIVKQSAIYTSRIVDELYANDNNDVYILVPPFGVTTKYNSKIIRQVSDILDHRFLYVPTPIPSNYNSIPG